MSQDFAQAQAFVAALTGNPEAVMSWRMIDDRDKAVPAYNRRGTLRECWQELCYYNSQGRGIFAVINETDGQGHRLVNLHHIRAHFVDLDNIMSGQNLQRAAAWVPAPSFAVQSSPGKFHVYWPVQPYRDLDGFAMLQRKFAQFFESDPKIIDAVHVMRVPGFWHCKGEPFLSHCWMLPGYGQQTTRDVLEVALHGVNVVAGGYGLRKPLGDAELAAPSLQWLEYGLNLIDPNQIGRDEWISTTAAFKQAGWTLAEPGQLFDIWSKWCGRYAANDFGENLKQWNDLTETQVGWKSLVNKIPHLKAYMTLGDPKKMRVPDQPAPQPYTPSPAPVPAPDAPETDPRQGFGEILTPDEQAQYFKGCYSIIDVARILTPKRLLLNSAQFNQEYGGKLFIISSGGKTTDEPFKAATRGTQFRLPTIDTMRFLPSEPTNKIVYDELGRSGINAYVPARIKRQPGDISRFLRHMEAMIGNEHDRNVIYLFMAVNAQRPGHKLAWGVLLQSAEGAGKGVIKELLQYIVGKSYFYSPKARDLAESGAKFNAWMRNKLIIAVDEIRTDEKREMIETLKPFISEIEGEVQGKGQDQKLEDNFTNWFFFSNYKDAIPINENSRRYAVIYSDIQRARDLVQRGMNEAYFKDLRGWMENGGNAAIYDWLMRYQLPAEIPGRAPLTSSWSEAVRKSQSGLERALSDAIADGLQGFRGGWVSSAALAARIKALGMRSTSGQVLEKVIEDMGFHMIGRALRPYLVEDAAQRSTLYHMDVAARVESYGSAQGYSD